MRITLAILVVLVVSAAQAQSTGSATSNGACSIANSGPNATKLVVNCGVGKAQGEKIIQLLNTLLAKKDVADIDAKLDQLIAMASQPVQQIVNCGNARNCAGTNTEQTYNQYGPPKYSMTDAQREVVSNAMQPFAGVPVTILYVGMDADVSAFGSQLASALSAAHLNVTQERAMMTDAPSGLFVWYGDASSPAANALAGSLINAGLIQGQMRGNKTPQPNTFTVVISPNR